MAHIVAKRFWRCRVLIPLDLSFLPTCSTDLYRSQIWIRFAPCLRNFGRSVGRPGLECQCFFKCQRQRRIDRMDRMDRKTEWTINDWALNTYFFDMVRSWWYLFRTQWIASPFRRKHPDQWASVPSQDHMGLWFDFLGIWMYLVPDGVGWVDPDWFQLGCVAWDDRLGKVWSLTKSRQLPPFQRKGTVGSTGCLGIDEAGPLTSAGYYVLTWSFLIL